MLAHALVSLTILGLVTASLAAGTTAAVRTAVQRAALRTAASELVLARQQLVAGIAQQVRNGGADAAFVAPPGLTRVPACAACGLTAEASLTLTGESSGFSSGPLTASAVQGNAGVDERRIAARVTAVVRGGDGTALATRTQFVTLRTLAVAPYAVVTGVLDGGDVSMQEEGDSAGATIGDDTRIHAVLLCSDGGSGACNGATPRPADDYADRTWDAGNAPPPGWNR